MVSDYTIYTKLASHYSSQVNNNIVPRDPKVQIFLSINSYSFEKYLIGVISFSWEENQVGILSPVVPFFLNVLINKFTCSEKKTRTWQYNYVIYS